MNSQPITAVMIVEDRRTIREGLALLIGGAPGLRCAGSFASIEQALPRVEDDPPDVVLVDLGLPGMSGTEGIRLFAARSARLTVAAMTVYEDDDRIFESICAGASGCLLKKTPPELLLRRLRTATTGGIPMSPEVARRALELLGSSVLPEDLELLELLRCGHNDETAAAELNLSPPALAARMKRIYGKLHARSRPALSAS